MTGASGAGRRQPWHARMRLRPLKGYITLSDAAEDLQISRQAVHRLVERGTLKAWTLGRGEKPVIAVRERDVRSLPVSPQRRREMEMRGEVSADLEDGLPGG